MSNVNQSILSTAASAGDGDEKYDQETTNKLSKLLAENMEMIAKGLEDIHSDMQLLHKKHNVMPEMFASLLNQLKPVADNAEEKKSKSND